MSYPTHKENLEIIRVLNLKEDHDQVPNSPIHKKVEDLKSRMREVLFLNEVFPAIQGEGPNTGKPVTFIRTYGCNLKCWFANPDGTPGCDTPYTWKKSATTESDLNKYTPEMLIDELSQYPNHNHWVVSGGEPMLQQKKFIKVIELYKEKYGNYPYIEMETNGTIIPDPEFDKYIWHYNVSVKLENSNATIERGFKPEDEEFNFNTPERRLKEDALNFFSKSEKSFFKFVVDRDQTVIPEIQDLVKEYNVPGNRVLLMPEGNSLDDMIAGSESLANTCQELGYRFSLRVHIVIYGFKRGV